MEGRREEKERKKNVNIHKTLMTRVPSFFASRSVFSYHVERLGDQRVPEVVVIVCKACGIV